MGEYCIYPIIKLIIVFFKSLPENDIHESTVLLGIQLEDATENPFFVGLNFLYTLQQ
jgi:hypothetical protein